MIEKNYLIFNYGTAASKSSYGSHPFYLMYEGNSTGVAHGVLLLNSNAMDITFTQAPALTYRTIGGVLDFLIFMGPTALEVLQQKANVIGHAPIPPYWALGFHLCRYGYASDAEIRETFDKNTEAGVPIDVQWADIDYMDDYNVFTYDKKNYANLPELIDYLHQHDRRFVPILDPALAYDLNETSAGYPALRKGLELDIFVKNTTDQLLLTKMWNPISVIADFTHPQAAEWWGGQMAKFYKEIQWDGLWIDMNEPAMIGYDGQIGGCVNNTLDRPQYNPAYPNVLESDTICMSSQHHSGIPHYNIHNVYSLFQAKITYEKMTGIRANVRPFLLSRASTTGQGRYSSHWTGDVDSSWQHMTNSIRTMLDFNLFGIPLIGADICGFKSNTTEELCARWSSLGAFYSFSRNHNMWNTVKQDPASVGGLVLQSAIKSLNLRYTLLPFLYTLFYHNSITGHPVISSLKINFPEDAMTNAIDRQFMWGDGILITPVLEPNVTEIDGYFPKGVWYDYQTRQVLSSGSAASIRLNINISDISIALRGGKIFPTISSVNMTTTDHRNGQHSFSIIAALDEEGNAAGDLFWDDGEQLDAVREGKYSLIDFSVTNHTFTSHCQERNTDETDQMIVKEVLVYGVTTKVFMVFLHHNDSRIPDFESSDLSFDQEEDVLIIHLPDATSLLNDFSLQWRTLE